MNFPDARIVINRKSEAEALLNVIQARFNTDKLDYLDWITIKQQVQMLLTICKNAVKESENK